MDRRDFLRVAAWSGLAVVAPQARSARAEDAPGALYDGPLYIMVKADGGWDPTYLCDPKGGALNKNYDEGDILTAGAIRYAPGLSGLGGSGTSFFQKYRDDLLLINGIDVSTNSHDSGRRYTWTGRLDNAGYPTFAALVAAARSPALALSHISFGYGATGGAVALSRLNYPQQVQSLANPYKRYERNDTYHAEATQGHIERARRERARLVKARHNLPRHRRSFDTMFVSKLALREFELFKEHVPDDLGALSGLEAQAAVVLAAYKAGVCVSANLSINGFDTHDNHEEKQLPKLDALLDGIDVIVERADRLGIRERVVLVVGSDFSRTPKYNEGRGKDHWSVGTMMMIGPGIRGGRVLGATDEGQLSRDVDPVTLLPSEGADAVSLKPEHVHRALRALAGIDDHELAASRFRLDAPLLPFFDA